MERGLMLRLSLSYVLIGTLMLQVPAGHTFQLERRVVTDDAREKHDTPSPHPLTWWTRNPLRLDEGAYPILGRSPDDGHVISARDFRIEQKVTTHGVVSGHRIMQVLTTFHAGPRLVFFGSPLADSQPSQWKSLLVSVGADDRYVEIYRLQNDEGTYLAMESAAIYGAGQDAILGTYDPADGNGGGCSDGYWWFDAAGAHSVDFSPLERAIDRAVPPNGTYTDRCWALHPEKAELESWVQRRDAECHACGGLGEIHATYRIKQGVAIPVSVRFEPERQE
jgi:hypothetical protein